MGIGRTILAVGLGALWAQEAPARMPDAATLIVLVHDLAAVSDDVLTGAEREVERIFSRADVHIQWLYCPAKPGVLLPDRPQGTILLRIVPTALDFMGGTAMGYALLPDGEAGHATVSYARVQRSVGRQKTSAAGLDRVLGHAMAHELGHVLLGPKAHSEAGLMLPNWDARHLNDMSKGRLHFTKEQAQRIHGGAVALGVCGRIDCSESASALADR